MLKVFEFVFAVFDIFNEHLPRISATLWEPKIKQVPWVNAVNILEQRTLQLGFHHKQCASERVLKRTLNFTFVKFSSQMFSSADES